MLTEVQRDQLKRRLLRKGTDISEDLATLLAGGGVDVNKLLGPGKPGETPIERLRRFLEIIDGQLRATRAGRYGLCDGCGAAIPYVELDAIPWQTTCRRCSAA